MQTFLTVAFDILLIFHFVGIGSLLGGFLTQMSAFKTRTQRVNMAMFHGSLTMLVSGILMAAVYGINHGDTLWGTPANYAKLFVKLVVLVIICWMVIAYRKKDKAPIPVVAGIGGLTLLNIIIAVVWS